MQGDTEDYHFKFRIMVIGDKGVGKTTFVESLSKNFGKVIEVQNSDELNITTIGLMDENSLYKIQYWELPGQQMNEEHFYRYCLGAAAVIFMFDVSKRSTFEKMEPWIQELDKHNIEQKVLVGNKVDLVNSSNSKSSVEKSEGQGLGRKYGMEYMESCSVGDSSVAPVYDHVFTSITQSIPNPPTPSSLIGKGIVLGNRLLLSTKYQLSLCDLATLYE